jgi:4'-phosphopantetheinyl transferase
MEFLNFYFQYVPIKFPKVLTLKKLSNMPLEKIVLESTRAWALWRIKEDEASLAARISPLEQISETITNTNKRLEWLAGRVLVKEVLASMALPFHGITKDEYGKPFPKGYDFHLSLSHSFPFVATLIDKKESAGIDLEQPKEKLLRIAPRIFHPEELLDAGNDITKHCIYWCAKETLVKVHGQKNLIFAENLLIDPFQMNNEGDISGRIIVADSERVIPLRYIVNPNFVVVFNQRTKI